MFYHSPNMEFKDIENINKEVIVKIKDMIRLKELIHYMEWYGFSVMTIQGITAEIKLHGEAYAVMNFLDAVKRRPGSFPKVIATLKHSKQMPVYSIFIAQIQKYFAKKQTQLAKVLSLISEEENELGLKEDHEEEGQSGSERHHNTGSGTLSQGGSSGLTSNLSTDNQWSTDIYRREDKSDKPPTRMSAPVKQMTPGRSNTNTTLITSSSLPSLDCNTPGASGNAGHSTHSQNVYVQSLDPAFAGAAISTLKANVYKMLGKALEETNLQGDDKEPWWNHMINNGDLNVSRKEQRQIGKHGSPGIEFLDILDDRDYTLQDLERLFIRFQINEALDILREHQNKVILENTSSTTKDNNLDKNQTPKADQNKKLNITISQTDEPAGPSEAKGLQMKRSLTDVSQTSTETCDLHTSPSSQSVARPNSSASNQSFDNNNDNSMSSLSTIEDQPIKGTVAIQACGDPTGVQSQPNPGEDAEKLRNDCVASQLDIDPQALENASPIERGEVDPERRALNQREDNNRNRELDQEEGEMTSPGHGESLLTGDNSCNPSNQDNSSGNLPLLSGLQSMQNDSGRDQLGQEGNNAALGPTVEIIPPRSFTSFEKQVGNVQSADGTQRTGGVNYLAPSLDDSREANIGSEISSGEISVERLNIDSISSVTSEPEKSLTEPDLLQGTRSVATDNGATNKNQDDCEN